MNNPNDLGPNANQFEACLEHGLRWAGADVEAYLQGVISHPDHGKFVVVSQEPYTLGATDEVPDTGLLYAGESGVFFRDPVHGGSMPFTGEQTASTLAAVVLAGILTGRPIHEPACPCCGEVD